MYNDINDITANEALKTIMRILYPYNEILPKKIAHDVYIARNCASLAAAGCSVELLCGVGSLSPAELADHYNLEPVAGLSWKTLPILRKNLGLPFTWNGLFFWGTQHYIRQTRPDCVVLSVLKQGAFQLSRKIPGVKYVYEVHELAWYPGREGTDARVVERIGVEREMFSKADVITVTTAALRDILLSPPYSVRTPVVVVPLAVDMAPLPAVSGISGDLEIMYVGQMYQGQGVELLLDALTLTCGVRLVLVGGKPEEVSDLKRLSAKLGISEKVTFTGFIAPGKLSDVAARCHALVAPFSATGRMPFVAHTKLGEYVAWQRPVIAPDLPVTREHFATSGGWIPFDADNAHSLATAMQSLKSADNYRCHAEACRSHHVVTWSMRSKMYLEILNCL